MRVLILAPHQDDEVILCGSFLKEMLEQGYDIYIVFMTNGDYDPSVRTVRLEEALQVMELYGVASNHVIFMGYANEYGSRFPHIYNASEGEIVASQYGNTKTYGLEIHPEYCYEKHGIHHTYTREHMINDLYEMIEQLWPGLIFTTGEEIHPDHSANSLILDEVIGILLKKYPDYKPLILKKPEYHTAWFGENDYRKINNPSARFGKYVQSVSVNGASSWFFDPYIRWHDRIRLPIDQYARCTDKRNNIVARALASYKSQNAEKHFQMLLNSDVVFWPRRTDSLTYTAIIRATSGEEAYLNDFKRNDSGDIKRRPAEAWKQSVSVWRPSPEDKRPVIEILLQAREVIDEIVIYQEYCPRSTVDQCSVVLDRDNKIWNGPLKRRCATVINFEPQEAKKIQIILESSTNQNNLPGITEIEVFPYQKTKLRFLKIMVDGDFVYHYILQRKQRGKVQLYAFDTKWHIHYPCFENVNLRIVDLYGAEHEKNEYFDIHQNLKKDALYPILLQVYVSDSVGVSDQILIFKNEYSEKKFSAVYKKLLDLKIPETDILSFYFGKRNEKFSFLKKFYFIARKKHCFFSTQIKYRFLKIFLTQKKRLSEGEKRDAFCFLVWNEVNDGIGSYVSQYIKGKLSDTNVIDRKPGKKIWLIGTPNHYNSGDHFIAFATKKFLEKMFGKNFIYEIQVNEFAGILPNLKKYIHRDDVIVLQGGGNMGNIYWTNERIRREVLARFPENPIFIFPETIFYETDIYGKKDEESSVKIYKKAKHLTICAREGASYTAMRKIYPFARILLTPDIVCSMEFPSCACRRQWVSLFLRSDREACFSGEQLHLIENVIQKTGMKYQYSDMIYNKMQGYSGKANRANIVRLKLKEFQNSRLVLTDRLHAMILSVLTGTPCVVFYGYNHKIPSTYETWFREIPYICLIRNIDDLEPAISVVLTADTNNVVPLKILRGKFRELKKEIWEAYQ